MNPKKSVFSNFIWRFLERIGAQGVTLLVSIVLARLLDPEIYGTVALISVFTTILNVFVDSGLGTALIQKKDADDLDFSSVFYFNLAVCVVLYLIMFICSPFIAGFYSNSGLTPIIRVASFILLISGLKNIQHAYVSRTMQFKRFFFSTLTGTIGAAFLGIWMAYQGFGIWALVVQNLFNQLVDAVFLWITVKWRPKRMFSFKRLKKLLSYGWKLLVSSLLDVLTRELRSLIIGKYYTSSDLAYYNKGMQFPNVAVTNINASIDSVLLPTLSREQENCENVKRMTRIAIKTSVYIMAPLMMGLAFIAVPFVRLLLTEKWLPSVFYLRIFCITYMFFPIHTANLNAIKALGRSDLFLKLEIMKKVVQFTALFLTMFISVEAMAYSLLVTSVMSQIINSWPNKKLLNYSYLDQLRDILPSILLAVVMGICVSLVSFFGLPDIVTIIIQILLGALIYFLGSKVTKNDSLEFVLGLAKGLKNNK